MPGPIITATRTILPMRNGRVSVTCTLPGCDFHRHTSSVDAAKTAHNAHLNATHRRGPE